MNLRSAPNRDPIPLDASLDAWPGRAAHLAGTAHYDRGEWIYEDYPWTAYGAAQPHLVTLYGLLDSLGNVIEASERMPGGLGFVIAQTGAGPLVDEADLAELRFAVRGSHLYVLARTTTMREPVRTALLLLFDTGHAGASYPVPFGSGVSTSAADTAVLVTAGGARVVDLATGDTIHAPAAANPADYVNALVTRLPLDRVGNDGILRFAAATGLVAPGSYQLNAGGAAGPLAKVVPRFDEPVQSVYDRHQALALAAHNIDRFLTDVSVEKLRTGKRERLLPGIGYSVRTFLSPAAISSEGGINGTLREYGLYVPQGFTDEPVPATLLLRGSSMTAHSLAAITPGLLQNLGDENGAVVVSPCGRSALDMFQGAAYADVLNALDDAESLLPIDPDRQTVAGYSMGGYATYVFAVTQPERFAGAFVIEGPVGGLQPATSLYPFPDVIPSLANLLYSPVEIFQGDIDADVPISNALAAVMRLKALGFRYRFNLLPANTHFTPGILNDYSIGARYLRQAKRVVRPSRVLYTRSMAFERAVDSGSATDQPGAGTSVGLSFSDAWFVHDLQASDPMNGTATADVRTFARPAGAVTPVLTAGVDTGPVDGQVLSPYEEQAWQVAPVVDPPRNELQAQLSGAARVRLDLRGMGMDGSRPVKARIGTDAPVTVAFTGRGCATEFALAAGDHVLDLLPCGD